MPRSPPTLGRWPCSQRAACATAMPSSIGTQDNPLRVAVVGSGPSGFYAAGHLLKDKERDQRGLQYDDPARRAAVIGTGNVPMHVTGVLGSQPDALAEADVAGHALEVLRRSGVGEVVALGGRGPAQAAFAHPELLELR